eukprot:1470268-Pyramimonas_sp.AAC.1
MLNRTIVVQEIGVLYGPEKHHGGYPTGRSSKRRGCKLRTPSAVDLSVFQPTPRSATQAECVLCWALCMQMGFLKPARIIDREDDYRKRRLNRLISPARNDAMAMVRAQSSSSVSFPRWCGSMHPTLVQLRFPLAISCCAGERFFYSCKRGESGRTQSARVNHAG